MVEDIGEARIRMLANDIGCGIRLAEDLLMLAGDDEALVREASCRNGGIGSVKAYILDKRILKIERERKSNV
ncbi:MAG: hypothetical protein K5859_03580 [Atopobiaceae bacterium]|nr:hypothetical protein [Atopobiaceae bacterium]